MGPHPAMGQHRATDRRPAMGRRLGEVRIPEADQRPATALRLGVDRRPEAGRRPEADLPPGVGHHPAAGHRPDSDRPLEADQHPERRQVRAQSYPAYHLAAGCLAADRHLGEAPRPATDRRPEADLHPATGYCPGEGCCLAQDRRSAAGRSDLAARLGSADSDSGFDSARRPCR